MDYTVRVEEAAARELAAVRGVASRADLGTTIRSLLDRVWAVVREQKVRTGHNVVVYYDGVMNIDVGVEIFASLAEVGGVRLTSTPGGTTATTAHFGDYSGLGSAYAAVNRWCADNGYHPTGPSWEVYGDWHEDPREVRTDVYLLVESETPSPSGLWERAGVRDAYGRPNSPRRYGSLTRLVPRLIKLSQRRGEVPDVRREVADRANNRVLVRKQQHSIGHVMRLDLLDYPRGQVRIRLPTRRLVRPFELDRKRHLAARGPGENVLQQRDPFAGEPGPVPAASIQVFQPF